MRENLIDLLIDFKIQESNFETSYWEHMSFLLNDHMEKIVYISFNSLNDIELLHLWSFLMEMRFRKPIMNDETKKAIIDASKYYAADRVAQTIKYISTEAIWKADLRRFSKEDFMAGVNYMLSNFTTEDIINI